MGHSPVVSWAEDVNCKWPALECAEERTMKTRMADGSVWVFKQLHEHEGWTLVAVEPEDTDTE